MSLNGNFRLKIINIFSCVLLSSFFATSVQAELILTAPPRESAADGNRDYGPLAEYLSNELGEKVVYKHPGSWFSYQRDIRSDKYDIVFDGPHFISWRIKNKGHTAVAKLPGDLGFVLIARANDAELNTAKDMIGETICGISPPNFSTLSVLKEYGDDGKPKLKTVKGGMAAVYKSFDQGNCKAAVLRDKFYYKKLSEPDRAKTKVIFTSQPFPNQGMTVSSRVSSEHRAKIADLLASTNPGTAHIIKRFAEGSNKMIPVDNNEYDSYDMFLTGVIIGW